MKAAVLHGVGTPITVEDVEVALPGPREVLVRPRFAGLCHSDLNIVDGDYPWPLPCVLGHEVAGVVEAVGADVASFKRGDHVVGCLSVFCGACPECLTGHPNRCSDATVKLPSGVSRRLSWKGAPLHQFYNLSAFAELMLVHEHALVRIDPDIPLDRAALLGCAVVTGAASVFHAAAVQPGQSVAVIGCGGVGLSCINAAAIAGAARIIAVDTLPAKLDAARTMGATDTLLVSDGDPVEAAVALTGGGVHHALEALGRKETAEQAFRMLRPGGCATIIGMIPLGTRIEIHGADLLRDRRIQGTAMGGNRFRVDIPMLAGFWRQGRLKLDHMISRRIGLGELNEGFALMRSGSQIRQLVDLAA